MSARGWLLSGLAVLTSALGARPLDASLSFSQDGGKTWSRDFPTVVSGAVVRVRAAYAIADSWEKRDVVCANIATDSPFASMTMKIPGGCMQRNPVYWKSSRENGNYTWNLDTGGLVPGTHVFRLEIHYWRQDGKGRGCELIDDSQPFYVGVTVGSGR